MRPSTKTPRFGLRSPEPPGAEGGAQAELSSAQEDRTGNEAAKHKEFDDRVVAPHSPDLLAYATTCLGIDGEDIVQDVLFNAWLYDVIAECGGNDQRIEKCLFRSMHNRLRDEYRRRRSERMGLGDFVASLWTRVTRPKTPYEDTELRDIASHLNRALKKLPPRCREAYVLVRLVGKKYAVVAESLDVEIKTVEAHVAKATEFLRQELAAVGYYADPDALVEQKEHRV